MMIIKIECINKDAAKWAHSKWPKNIIRRGKAIICIDIAGDEIGYIMQQVKGFDVFVGEGDQSLIDERVATLSNN